MTDLVAAIDCGTNSTRLLVARSTGNGRLVEIERLTTITRLGEGVDETGRLSEDALGRVVHCLQDYREVLDRHQPTSVRMIATSAARDAENRDHFFDLAEAVIGVRPELLSGPEEAELSFRGATAELDPRDGPFLVVDIGGGSTEFAYGVDTCMKSLSAQLGCVRLSEQYVEHDPALPEELVACLSIVELHLEDVVREIPEAPHAVTLVGLAGTVTATAAIEQGLVIYDRDQTHHFDLTKDAVEDVFRTLATENREQRLENPGMEEGRVDVIVAGLCILVRTMRQFDFERCLVSEADILDGLLLGGGG
jgi:exopolyphosphatase/guanosine-5'-triphosphate,3'-diphosphate pyrophosphatase